MENGERVGNVKEDPMDDWPSLIYRDGVVRRVDGEVAYREVAVYRLVQVRREFTRKDRPLTQFVEVVYDGLERGGG